MLVISSFRRELKGGATTKLPSCTEQVWQSQRPAIIPDLCSQQVTHTLAESAAVLSHACYKRLTKPSAVARILTADQSVVTPQPDLARAAVVPVSIGADFKMC